MTSLTYVYADGSTHALTAHNPTLIPTIIVAGLYIANVVKVLVSYNGEQYVCVRNPSGGYIRTEV